MITCQSKNKIRQEIHNIKSSKIHVVWSIASIEYSRHIFTKKKNPQWFAWEFLAEKMKTGLMHDFLLNFRDLWEQRW